MPFSLTQLSPQEIENLPREHTVFFFSVAPLEDYGPHLPIDCALIGAEKISQLSAQFLERELPDWKAVLMPSLPLGIESHTQSFALTVRAHVLRDWLVDSCQCLTRYGFIHFVCFSGNLGAKQITAIEEAGDLIRGCGIKRWIPFVKRPRLISGSSGWISFFKDVLQAPLGKIPAEHGGQEDTSLLLSIQPQAVHPEFIHLPPLPPPQRHWWNKKIKGYWGDPSAASKEEGDRLLSQKCEILFPHLKEVWEGREKKNWNPFFRSGYSVFPQNKSFFKSWLLVLGIVALFFAWKFLYTWF